MERKLFGKKTLNKQRPRVDRFVTAREDLPDMKRRFYSSHNLNTFDQNFDIWHTKYLQQKKYTEYLDEAFGLESMKYHEPYVKDKEYEEYHVPTWPCIPRKRSYLKSADSILDLPTYSYAPFPELLDWSNDNVLVAALGKVYHKWSWRTQNLISKGWAINDIRCCKFNPRGELLALGTENGRIEIHNNALSKYVAGNNCHCGKIGDACSITAIDWSPTGNSLVTGCSNGMLVSYTRDARVLHMRKLQSSVLTVKVSPDARYVATAYVNGIEALLFSWPELRQMSILDSDWTVKTIAWHPWKTALLGVGTVTAWHNAHIAIWDAPSSRIRQMTVGSNHYSLDAMLFSNKTGELVMSLWDTDRATQRKCSQLVVMSDPNTVVDQWGEGRSGLDRVRTMIFSPDGTKLATATADEDLIIWNFLPDDKEKKKKKRRHSDLPVYLDVTSQGYSLR